MHRTDGEEEVEDEESHTASTTKGQEDDGTLLQDLASMEAECRLPWPHGPAVFINQHRMWSLIGFSLNILTERSIKVLYLLVT